MSLQNMYANGTIVCATIVIPDSTHINSVKAAVDGSVLPAGIASNAPRVRPDPSFTMSALSAMQAAIAGEILEVYGPGSTGVDLYCNAVWSPGDLIMADASGYGVVATTTNYYAARAQGTGVVGAYCPVDVMVGYTK